MHPDLERLVALQALDSELQQLTRAVDTEAERRKAIENGVEARRAELAGAKTRVAENQHVRREIEKELAQVQVRLSRYRDQLMAVKTNKEYHAMQTEIQAAEAEVSKFEDRILEAMVDGDEMTAALRSAEQALAKVETDAVAAIGALASETSAAKERLTIRLHERAALAKALPSAALTMFETIASRRGAATAQVRDGHCSVCHVSIRQQVFQELRRSDGIMQCDSCQRILYWIPPGVPSLPAGQ